MKERLRNPWFALGLILFWRVALLVFTAQPVPANDAFLFDGGVINWLRHGEYCNPSLIEAYPISGHLVFSAYPPIYQVVLLVWMSAFGMSAFSAMLMHFLMFSAGAFLVVRILQKNFPANQSYALAVLFLAGITFNDRPEDLGHIFGLAALLLTVRHLDGKIGTLAAEAGITLLLLCALYTSPVVGAFYFGCAFLTRTAAWFFGRRISIAPFIAVVILFAVITSFIVKIHPLWWRGFLENAHTTPSVGGFRLPSLPDLLKMFRAAPVFLLAVIALPFLLARREKTFAVENENKVWLPLTIGVAAMGLMLLAAAMLFLSPNYVAYGLYVQVLLAAGLLTLARGLELKIRRWFSVLMICSLALVSVRLVGISTWGVACASDVSYGRADEIVRAELQPFANSGARIVLSSAFLYRAAQMDVRDAVHADWLRDKRVAETDGDFKALVRLRPPKLILTQFDYYRAYQNVVEELRQHPELVTVSLRDAAKIRPPEAIPALSRVVQHVSWAPVVVEFSWK
jgi:hypothetical protein